MVGNSITDFDAYYAGVVGDGPKRPKPRKFLEEPVTGFVERMARERPPGWRDAAGVCLDLSIPELAFALARQDVYGSERTHPKRRTSLTVAGSAWLAFLVDTT